MRSRKQREQIQRDAEEALRGEPSGFGALARHCLALLDDLVEVEAITLTAAEAFDTGDYDVMEDTLRLGLSLRDGATKRRIARQAKGVTCSACGMDLTPTPAQIQALFRFGNPLRRPPCLETESGYHRIGLTEQRNFENIWRVGK